MHDFIIRQQYTFQDKSFYGKVRSIWEKEKVPRKHSLRGENNKFGFIVVVYHGNNLKDTHTLLLFYKMASLTIFTVPICI